MSSINKNRKYAFHICVYRISCIILMHFKKKGREIIFFKKHHHMQDMFFFLHYIYFLVFEISYILFFQLNYKCGIRHGI